MDCALRRIARIEMFLNIKAHEDKVVEDIKPRGKKMSLKMTMIATELSCTR